MSTRRFMTWVSGVRGWSRLRAPGKWSVPGWGDPGRLGRWYPSTVPGGVFMHRARAPHTPFRLAVLRQDVLTPPARTVGEHFQLGRFLVGNPLLGEEVQVLDHRARQRAPHPPNAPAPTTGAARPALRSASSPAELLVQEQLRGRGRYTPLLQQHAPTSNGGRGFAPVRNH